MCEVFETDVDLIPKSSVEEGEAESKWNSPFQARVRGLLQSWKCQHHLKQLHEEKRKITMVRLDTLFSVRFSRVANFKVSY